MLAVGLQNTAEKNKATEGERAMVGDLILNHDFYSTPSNAFALSGWLGLLGLTRLLLLL